MVLYVILTSQLNANYAALKKKSFNFIYLTSQRLAAVLLRFVTSSTLYLFDIYTVWQIHENLYVRTLVPIRYLRGNSTSFLFLILAVTIFSPIKVFKTHLKRKLTEIILLMTTIFTVENFICQKNSLIFPYDFFPFY